MQVDAERLGRVAREGFTSHGRRLRRARDDDGARLPPRAQGRGPRRARPAGRRRHPRRPHARRASRRPPRPSRARRSQIDAAVLADALDPLASAHARLQEGSSSPEAGGAPARSAGRRGARRPGLVEPPCAGDAERPPSSGSTRRRERSRGRRRDGARRRDHGLALGLGDDAPRRRDARRSSACRTRCGSSRPTARPTCCSSTPRARAERGLEVIIAGAGGAAHLPGMCAAKTALPGARRAGGVAGAAGHGLAALDRADAGRRPGRHARHRARRGGQRRRCWPRRSWRGGARSSASALDAWRRRRRTDAVLADPDPRAPAP